MSIVFALTKLFDDVVARFALDAAALDPPVDPVPNLFGWRKPTEQMRTSHRIAWVPGDDESGDLGTIDGARFPGRNPRPLATLVEVFTVYIEAFDIAAPNDEQAQYQATRELFDAWYRAVYLAARGTFSIQRSSWLTERTVSRRGGALRVLCTIDAMVPDAPSAIAPVDTRAEIEVAELDLTETMESAPAAP